MSGRRTRRGGGGNLEIATPAIPRFPPPRLLLFFLRSDKNQTQAKVLPMSPVYCVTYVPVHSYAFDFPHASTHRHRRLQRGGHRTLLPNHLPGRRGDAGPARPSRRLAAHSFARRVYEVHRSRRLDGRGGTDDVLGGKTRASRRGFSYLPR